MELNNLSVMCMNLTFIFYEKRFFWNNSFTKASRKIFSLCVVLFPSHMMVIWIREECCARFLPLLLFSQIVFVLWLNMGKKVSVVIWYYYVKPFYKDGRYRITFWTDVNGRLPYISLHVCQWFQTIETILSSLRNNLKT